MFDMHRVKNAACMLLAVPATFSFSFFLRTGQNLTMLNRSLASIFLWWGCWRILQKAAQRINRRLVAVCLPLGMLFSVMMVAGAHVMQFETALFHEWQTWVGIACAVPLFSALSVLVIRDSSRMPALHWEAAARRLEKLSSKQFFWLCCGLIFAAWLPGLVAAYPGVYGYDGVFQLDYYLKGSFSTHHPVLHSWWYGFCTITLGEWLGSREAGMCVYIVQQMLILASAFASILSFLRRRGAGPVMLLSCLMVFMFLPSNAVFSISTTKDVVFSALIAWTLLWLLDTVQHPERLKSWKKWMQLLLFGLGIMAMRKQGVYVFAGMLAVGLCLMPGCRRRMAALLAAFIVLFAAYEGPIYTWMKAERVESIQEMLSVPIMQLCRVRTQRDVELTQEQYDAIEAYIPDWRNYGRTTWAIADPMKNTFNAPLFHEDPAAFVRLWAQVGLKYPLSYIDAFLRLTAGYWYPDMPLRDWAAQQPYYQYGNIVWDGWVQIERTTPAALQWLHDLYEDLSTYNSANRIPVISLLNSAGVAAWTLMLFTGWAVYQRRWRLLWPASMLWLLYATILLGPVMLMRYAYPLLMAQPVLIGVMRTSRDDS